MSNEAPMPKKQLDSFIRFDRTPIFDRQTQTQTDTGP